jgi:hypothetical protein
MRVVFAFCLLIFIVTAASAQFLPECYHTRAEVDSFVFALQASDPAHVRVDSIGHSRGDMLGMQYPIWAVKISGNARVFEDKPTVLIIGHIHAEEVIGMEMTLEFMWRLVHPFGLYRELLNNTQLYFIPTMNPDGLEVISRGLDNTWRKNGYHPPELGARPCTIHQGAGGDSCGVDLNRNFELNWIYGDTLWYPIRTPLFDYYSGPAAFSEPEAQTVAAFAERIKPTMSLVFHSSRQGGNAKLGIAAWKWGDDPGPYRFPPDCTAIGWLNFNYCQKLDDEAYSAVYGGNHDGNLQDWFYWKLGCIQINNELGPLLNIQPVCSTLTRIINEDIPALEWFCKRPINLGLDGLTPLSIYTRDTDGHALSARYKILNTWSPILAPWYTNSEFGRATVFPPTGQVRIAAFKFGYRPDTVTTWINPLSYPQQVQLDLQPLPFYGFQIPFQDSSGQPLLTYAHLEQPDSSFDFRTYSMGGNLPAGEYTGRFWAEGHMAVWRSFYLSETMSLPVTLPTAYLLWSDNFENGLGNWNTGGTNNPWRLAEDTTALHMGQTLVFNPPGFRQMYAPHVNMWIAMNSTVNLTENAAYLEFFRRGRMDVPNDSLLLEISTDGGSTWQQVAGYCDQDIPWTQTFVDLRGFVGHSISARFHVISDGVLGELGYHLKNVKIFSGTDRDAVPEHPLPAVYTYRLTNAYPNPFNPSTVIAYETAAPGAIAITVHNVLGQEVRRFDLRELTAGPHRLFWDGTAQNGAPLGSGVYFVRLHAASSQNTIKLLLLR